MFPAYIDPIGPALVPAFASALRGELLELVAVTLVGVVVIVGLVALDVARAGRRRSRAVAATSRPTLRLAA